MQTGRLPLRIPVPKLVVEVRQSNGQPSGPNVCDDGSPVEENSAEGMVGSGLAATVSWGGEPGRNALNACMIASGITAFLTVGLSIWRSPLVACGGEEREMALLPEACAGAAKIWYEPDSVRALRGALLRGC